MKKTSTIVQALERRIGRRLLLKIIAGIFLAIIFIVPIFRKKIQQSGQSDRVHKNKRGDLRSSVKKSVTVISKVVSVYNPKATTWDYSSGYYIDYVDQKEINKTLDVAVVSFTGKASPSSAWMQIMRSYKKGDKIAIKPNFNCADKHFDIIRREIMTSPQILNAIIFSLVKHLGVPEKDIIIYDLCRPIPKRAIRKYISYDVTYVEIPGNSLMEKVKHKLRMGLASGDKRAKIKTRQVLTNAEGERVICLMPKLLDEVAHVINVPVVKYHQFGINTITLKNHMGTVRLSDLSYYPMVLHGKSFLKSIVDISKHPYIKEKTRLNVVDFLFGSYDYKTPSHNKEVKKKWLTFPDGVTPNRIIISDDPIAVESVVFYFMAKERRQHHLPEPHDLHLHDAMGMGLGVHERVAETREFRKIAFVEKTFS